MVAAAEAALEVSPDLVVGSGLPTGHSGRLKVERYHGVAPRRRLGLLAAHEAMAMPGRKDSVVSLR